MKKILFLDNGYGKVFWMSRLLCFLCMWVGFSACSKDEEGRSNKGVLRLRMEVDAAMDSVQTKSVASDFAAFKDVNGYKVQLLSGTSVVAEYARFDKMPEEVELEPGEYTIRASKGAEEAGIFGTPYFFGEQDFRIEKEMTSTVEVTAACRSSRVTVDFSKDFLDTYPEYTLSFKTDKMTLPLVYEQGESRAMYFQAEEAGTKLAIAMELVNVYGKEVAYNTTVTVKPKQWSQLTVRTDEKGLNGLALDVTLDDGTKETEYVNIGIPDFMERLKGAPFIFTTGTTVKWSETNEDEEFEKSYTSFVSILKVPVTVTAGGKIDKLLLSVYEGEKVLRSYDLANLDPDQRKELKEDCGLELPEEVKGTVNVNFDLQGFLRSLFDKENRNYVVELSVVDALPNPNRTTKKIIATYTAMVAPKINSVTVGPFEGGTYTSSKSITISSCYLPLKSFTFGEKEGESIDLILNEIQNISFTRSTAQTPTSYTLKIDKEWFNALSEGEHVFIMKAVDAFDRVVENTLTVTVTIPVFEWALAENDGDIFAKYAYLRVKAKDADKVTFYQNGTPITGLIPLGKDDEGVVSYVWKHNTPNKSYSITAGYADGRALPAISFTTEEERQLPNAGFEDWTKEFVCNNVGKVVMWFKGKNIDRWTPDFWSTNNEETTSGNPVPSFWLRAFPTVISAANASEYCPYETISFSGKSAAVISTIGWGNDLSWISGTPTNTVGKLYIDDLSWNSRPAALQFACQFASYNNEKFGVKIFFKNENKEIIEELNSKLSEGDIKDGKIVIQLPKYLSKVSYLSLLFLSSASEEAGTGKVEGKNNTDIGGLSQDKAKDDGHNDSRYIGNTLVIDDVELIYDYE